VDSGETVADTSAKPYDDRTRLPIEAAVPSFTGNEIGSWIHRMPLDLDRENIRDQYSLHRAREAA
jgi:hypothetical protein